MSNRNRVAQAAFLVSVQAIAAQGTSLPKTFESGKAVAIFVSSCASCHDWAASYDTIIASGLVTPGKPDESRVWAMIDSGRMPADGSSLDADQKAAIRDWIAAGAPKPAAGASTTGVSPASASTASATPFPASRFLGFKSKEAFHRFSGWTSGGILLAAAGVGTWHLVNMMSDAHAYRDRLGIDEFNPVTCDPTIASVWGSSNEQALRWTHLGLLAAGETFYFANAFTGTSFMQKLGPGWSKAKIHRYAFFLHAGLMVTEGVLGYFSSDALSRGDHDLFHNLLIAHAAVGFAIPVVILGAGAIMDL